MKAVIYENELDFIARCVMDYPNIETGGDLFGFWTHSGYPSIQYVLGPGPDSDRGSTEFYQDKKYLIEMGKRLRGKYGLQHIGEWHSHHQLGLKEPSGGDKNTIIRAIKTYGLNYFFLTICTIEHKAVNIRGFHFSAGDKKYEDAGWIILDGESPIRREFDRDNKNWIYRPKERIVPYVASPTTTLEADAATEEEEAPKFPEGSWMNSKEGKEILKSITEFLKQQFGDVKIFQTEDRRIKIEVDTNKKQFLIVFPHDFPKSKPDITILNKSEGSAFNQFLDMMNDQLSWREDKYKNYITNYITALYSIDEITQE